MKRLDGQTEHMSTPDNRQQDVVVSAWGLIAHPPQNKLLSRSARGFRRTPWRCRCIRTRSARGYPPHFRVPSAGGFGTPGVTPALQVLLHQNSQCQGVRNPPALGLSGPKEPEDPFEKA